MPLQLSKPSVWVRPTHTNHVSTDNSTSFQITLRVMSCYMNITPTLLFSFSLDRCLASIYFSEEVFTEVYLTWVICMTQVPAQNCFWAVTASTCHTSIFTICQISTVHWAHMSQQQWCTFQLSKPPVQPSPITWPPAFSAPMLYISNNPSCNTAPCTA